MQWYQMFEYAIGHWLQKATEHVMGCVLCSPGCFSLFRAEAIMDENVMRTYTTVATEPRHYVQYDQGEDRWLCTLLLQQGKFVYIWSAVCFYFSVFTYFAKWIWNGTGPTGDKPTKIRKHFLQRHNLLHIRGGFCN